MSCWGADLEPNSYEKDFKKKTEKARAFQSSENSMEQRLLNNRNCIQFL